MQTTVAFKTFKGWEFSQLMPGTFKRNKKQFEHLTYPIIGPLPTHKGKTRPLEECGTNGPFIYFIVDETGAVRYVGKSHEDCVLERWIRPDNSTPPRYFWTHSIQSGGNVFNIAEGLCKRKGPFTLRYTTLAILMQIFGNQFGIDDAENEKVQLKKMEGGLQDLFQPDWNKIK